MDHQDAIVAHLNRLDRRITRIGGGVLGLFALGLFAAMAFQDSDTVAVQDIVRTQRLELTNSQGEVVAVLSAVDQDVEILTAYHDNGLKEWQVSVKDNQYEGRYVRWNSRGFKFEEGEYRNGRRHGLWQFWEDERLRTGFATRSSFSYLEMQGAFAEGLRTGIWTTWHSAEQKDSEGEYVNDVMVGDWRFWNVDGSIDEQQTGFYENGVKIR